MLYNLEWEELRKSSQGIMQDPEIKDINNIKDLVDETVTLDMSSIFSQSPFSSVPTSSEEEIRARKALPIQRDLLQRGTLSRAQV